MISDLIDPPLNVTETDASPNTIPVFKVVFPSASVTDNLDGSVTVTFNSSSNPFNPLYITATTYFKYEGGQLNLYVNGNVEASWQYTPVAPGMAMGNLGGVYA